MVRPGLFGFKSKLDFGVDWPSQVRSWQRDLGLHFLMNKPYKYANFVFKILSIALLFIPILIESQYEEIKY